MVHFTKQEKTILFVLGVVIFLGSFMDVAVKTYPQTRHFLSFLDDNKLARKINVNTASAEQLVELPFIGEFTAEKIIAGRKKNGPFKSVEDVGLIQGIRQENFNKFKMYLTIR